MNKKIISLALTGIMLLSLTACSEKAQLTPVKTEPTKQTQLNKEEIKKLQEEKKIEMEKENKEAEKKAQEKNNTTPTIDPVQKAINEAKTANENPSPVKVTPDKSTTIPSAPTTLPNQTTKYLNGPSGYNTTLRDQLVEKVDAYKVSAKDSLMFKAVNDDSKAVLGHLQGLVDSEAKKLGSAGEIIGFPWAKTNAIVFAFENITKVYIETENNTADGILSALKANKAFTSSDLFNIGVVSVHYNSSTKKNQVVVFTAKYIKQQ